MVRRAGPADVRDRRAFRCYDRAARRHRLVVALTLNKRLRCQPVDTSYGRIVARSMLHAACCRTGDPWSARRSLPVPVPQRDGTGIGGGPAWVCAGNTTNIRVRPIAPR